MTTAEPAFDALLARARAGDEEALAELARRYEPEVRAVARVRLGPALRPYLDSIDLVQSVHKGLLLGRRQNKFAFTGPDQLIALALTIVRRKVARQWQKVRRQQRPDGDSGANLPDLILNLAADTPDPARTAEARVAVDRLCRNLDAADRQLLELSAKSYRTVEIAARLGQNADVLRVRISRLRAKLRSAGVAGEWL